MSNDNYYRAAKQFKDLYDSDEDLDPQTQDKIRKAGSESMEADKYRKEGWDKADAWTKTKSVLKDYYYGDKRAKK